MASPINELLIEDNDDFGLIIFIKFNDIFIILNTKARFERDKNELYVMLNPYN